MAYRRVYKKDNKAVWIIGILLIGVLIYGGNAGWFKFGSNTTNTTNDYNNMSTEDLLNSPVENPTAQCNVQIQVTPQVINSGDMDTGILTASPNTNCAIWVNYGGVWRIYNSVTTDSSGKWSLTTPVVPSGQYRFRAICDNNCLSNLAILNVN